MVGLVDSVRGVHLDVVVSRTGSSGDAGFVSRMFSSFRSRWATPWQCAWRSAQQTCAAGQHMVGLVRGLKRTSRPALGQAQQATKGL